VREVDAARLIAKAVVEEVAKLLGASQRAMPATDNATRPKWIKMTAACAYAGGVSRKAMYRAIASGKLRAARIGAGRNMVFCEQWIDDWLSECANDRPPRTVPKLDPAPVGVDSAQCSRSSCSSRRCALGSSANSATWSPSFVKRTSAEGAAARSADATQ
jgi:predicted DNA-binding transcriptional regulator AlpA